MTSGSWSPEPVTTGIVRTRKEAFELEEEFVALYGSLSCPNVYYSPEWVYTWLETLGRRHEVFFVVARQGGRLVGVWPFFEYRLPAFGKGLLPVGAQAADQFDPVGIPEAIEPMVKALAEAMPEFRFAWLPLVSREFAEGVLKPCMEQMRSPHLLRWRTPRFLVEMDRFEDFTRYIETVFGPKTRQTLRRKERRLSEEGEVVMKVLADAKEWREWFPRMVEVEGRSWKVGTGDGIFQKAELRTFYKLLLERLLELGQARVAILTLDGKLLAYEIGFIGKDSYGMHSTVFDEEFATFSPGRLLMLFSIQTCFEEGRRIYDFLQNDAEFKRQLSSRESRMWDWILLPRSLSGRLTRIVLSGVQAWTDRKNRNLHRHGALERDRRAASDRDMEDMERD
jgi:CelD/BcsL family acetyltransferase involved in cellulose biosynthesis